MRHKFKWVNIPIENLAVKGLNNTIIVSCLYAKTENKYREYVLVGLLLPLTVGKVLACIHVKLKRHVV